MMKIAVLGSGSGGCAVAFDWAQHGHDVYMFDFEEFPANIDAINKKGGITSTGMLEGFADIKYAGHDMKTVADVADLIFAVGPAYSTEPFGKAIKPYLKEGQVVIVSPSSCGGSIVFKNAIGVDLLNDDYIIAETSTLPYAVRVTEPGSINVFLKLKGGLFIAAVPSKYTEKVYNLAKNVYPSLVPVKNILQTTLQNGNPVIHPSVTLLNAALIERTNGNFYFYEEGVTKAVGWLMKAVDEERLEIGKKLGIEIINDPVIGVKQGYMQDANYDKGFSEAKGFKGIKAQSSLDYRYFNEDVGYGLVFMTDLAKHIGVETPIMNSIINIVSVIMDRDYRSTSNRTLKALGLDRYDLDKLKKIL